jgi:hypothetical protein
MTTDKNFRLSKTAKARVALSTGDAEHKAHLKRMMISAQSSEESARRSALKSKDRGDRNSHVGGAASQEPTL